MARLDSSGAKFYYRIENNSNPLKSDDNSVNLMIFSVPNHTQTIQRYELRGGGLWVLCITKTKSWKSEFHFCIGQKCIPIKLKGAQKTLNGKFEGVYIPNNGQMRQKLQYFTPPNKTAQHQKHLK